MHINKYIQSNFQCLSQSRTKTKNATWCVLVKGISHLGIVTDHVEPEDRCPGALLLAGVGDDDHREGGGLGCVPGKNNFYFGHISIIKTINTMM